MTDNHSEPRCILCGQSPGANGSFLRFPQDGGQNEILRCGCGLLYLRQMPDRRGLNEHYEQESGYVRAERPWRDRLRRIIPARFKSIAIRPGTGAVLDIGFGNAALLDECRRMGLETWGVELSPLACERARAKGHRVVHGSLDDLAIFAAVPRNYFGHVVLSHVVEHLLDPVGCLTFLRQFLLVDGVLIVVVPNGESCAFRLLTTDWGAFNPDHLFYFDQTTLSRVVEKAGYRVAARTGKRYLEMNLRRLAGNSRRRMDLLGYVLHLLTSRAPSRFDALTVYARRS